MKNIPDAKTTRLKNGLTIVTENITALRSVTMGVLVGAGGASETAAESGYSHFIEHLAFKGTRKRSAYDIAHALDAVGGKINAYTGKEYTMYYAIVLDEHIDTAIDVLCDILLNSTFAPEHLEMEKGVILEEIKMYEDTPDELIHDFFAEHMLPGHPIGRPTIGTHETIRSARREDILAYRDKCYSPKNTVVSLAGDLPSGVVDKLKPFLEAWQGPAVPPPPPEPQIKGSINFKHKKTEQVHLCLGVKGVSQVAEERYPYAILDSIVGGSMSSRLFQEVREKRGLAYSIFSTSSPFRNFGISYVYAGTSQENLEQVIELILAQFRQVKHESVTSEELARAREHLKGNLVLGLEATSARMNWLAKSEFYYDRAMTIDEIFKKVDKVTQDDIIALANRYFKDEYLTLAVIGDLEKLPLTEIHC